MIETTETQPTAIEPETTPGAAPVDHAPPGVQDGGDDGLHDPAPPQPEPDALAEAEAEADREEELFRDVLGRVLDAIDAADRFYDRPAAPDLRRTNAAVLARSMLVQRDVSGPDLERLAGSIAAGACDILAKEEAEAAAGGGTTPAEAEHGPEPDPGDDALHDALCAHLFKLVSSGQLSPAEGGPLSPAHRLTAAAELELRRRGYRPGRARVDVAHRAALEVLRPQPQTQPEAEPQPEPPTLAELAVAVRMGREQVAAALGALATASAEDQPAILARVERLGASLVELEALLPDRPAFPQDAECEPRPAPMPVLAQAFRVDAPARPRGPSLVVPGAMLTMGMLLQAGAFAVLALQNRKGD